MFRTLIASAALLIGLSAPPATCADTDATLLNPPELRSYSEMLDLRVIRALVVRNKTGYFFDGGRQRGLTRDLLKLFEKQLNEQLNRGHLKVHVIMLPVRRDELIPALLEGRGDIAAANLTVTPERQQLVDFSNPLYKNVRELVVTSAGVQSMSSINDIAGMEIYV